MAAALTAPLVVMPASAAAADDTVSATSTDVVVNARVAYQRAPVSDLDNPAFLEGTTFELHTVAGDHPGVPTGYSCEIADGALDCIIEVPDTGPGGMNEGARFFVVMTDAGEAAYPIPSLMTGTSSEPATLRFYPGVTPPWRRGDRGVPAAGEG
ncbi:hypothetical protein [Microbacterium yannicii]|uniref:hypothetical protein n=1 Tax=Microbacterium yannicii TaxID=671622 RepID=UPI00037DD97C|nr:hypothetical protein [Microbacterium yannicii]